MKAKRLLASITLSILCFSTAIAQNKTSGLVSSATPEATESGALILKKGGNAIDAAIAVAFTLGVTEPAMSGIGGRTMLILSFPNQEPIAIGGISLTPSILDSDIEKKDLTLYKQVSIPSQVKILNYIWKKYGSGHLKWEELLQSAIHYAEHGFVNGVHRHHVFKRVQQKFTNSPYHNRELLIDNGIPAIGDLIKQPTLAKTLKKIAVNGAEDFYKGDIAKEIAEDFKKNDGWITYSDLSNFPEPKEHKPLHVNYRGYDIYSFVPPGGGWQVLQVLNLLEQYNVNDLKVNTNERTLAMLNVLNLSHNDRLDNPIKDYSNFQTEIDEKVSKSYAKSLFETSNNTSKSDADPEKKGHGETTHFSVIDKDGVAVSVTSSLGAYFGSNTSTKSLGFFYNSYLKSLMGFGLGKSLEPNVIIPSSMSPSLVKKDGRNVLVIGTPGSKRIVSTTSQLIQLWIDSEMSITDIINVPRVHAIRNLAYIEDENITSENLQNIRNNGFKIRFPNYDLTNKFGLNAYFGGVHAIEFKYGEWNASADPRRDGTIKIINE
jgi:gamma-glutamyltranspeptidase/glutathione hydrolase